MKKIFVLIFLISMVLVVSLIGLRNLEEEKNYQGEATLIIRTIGDTTEETLNINGLTALEILEKNHNIEIFQTGPNKFVKCVDDVCAKGGYWWQFFVNEELILKSLDSYYPKDGDRLLLEYGEEE